MEGSSFEDLFQWGSLPLKGIERRNLAKNEQATKQASVGRSVHLSTLLNGETFHCHINNRRPNNALIMSALSGTTFLVDLQELEVFVDSAALLALIFLLFGRQIEVFVLMGGQ